MGRRKSKLSTLSIFRRLYSSIAVVLGIASESRLSHRIATKRCGRKNNVALRSKNMKKQMRTKSLQRKKINVYDAMKPRANLEFNHICKGSELTIINNSNNNNRSVESLIYDDLNCSRLTDVDQQRIFCILVENKKTVELIQQLFTKHSLIFKNNRIIDLQELVQLIKSTTANITHEDASTMTSINQICRQTASCASFITQSNNSRRLKALEFIRIFIEMSKEDFFEYLINEEHLCQQKTSAIYQMIKQFLKVIYQSEHSQNQNVLYN